MSRRLACALLIFGTLLTSTVHAQDTAVAEIPAPPAPETTAPETATSATTETATVEAVAPETTRIPKIAIVIAGDPDPSALAATQALESVLAADPRVTMPSDPAVRAALRGEGSADGLDELRAERRRLGLGEARDVSVVTVLGELASADLVLVVRSAHGTTSATAFDVLRRSFYDGAIALEPIDDAETVHFVVRRARRAARPLDASETTAAAVTPSVDPATAVPPEAIAADPEQPAHEPDFFEQYWPYFAAGALLIGAVVFIVLTTQTSATPPPVLRFEAGGGS